MRDTIPKSDLLRIQAEAPAPAGTSWSFDPAASSDRMRLFWDDPYVGEIGGAYPDGTWWVGNVWFNEPTASGSEEGGLLAAMQKVVEVARALGALDVEKARRRA